MQQNKPYKMSAYRFGLIIFVFLLFSCGSDSSNSPVSFIPQPKVIEMGKGDFQVSSNTVILINDSPEQLALAEVLQAVILKNTSVELKIEYESLDVVYRSVLKFHKDESLENDAYTLTIKSNEVVFSGSKADDWFYAIQTFKQIFLSIEDKSKLPQLFIDDRPNYRYRGLMLDVSRHFFTPDEIKKVLDEMAFYKLNKFHWHLTDDQGWRIEIKQYPLLTDIGSYRQETMVDKNFDPFIGDGIPHSGYYTQNEIRDIVQYAQERFIEVIPEIDLPGHMQSALAAYPELGCNNRQYTVSTRWGVHHGVLCPNEYSFQFIQTVLGEIVDLFPGEYIHIGGDEVPLYSWQSSELAQRFMVENNLSSEREIQYYFYQYSSDILSFYDRKAVGWDEVVEDAYLQPTTVMAWRGMDHGIDALESGHHVIFTPSQFTYLNYYQANQATEPLAQCCMITLKSAYDFSTELAKVPEHLMPNVLGGQASLWTEYIKTPEHLEYMLFPRLLAISESLWINESQKDWTRFNESLEYHYQHFEEENINFHQ